MSSGAGWRLTEEPIFLTNLWYMAGLSASLKPGGLRREMLCGEPVLLDRGKDGRAFALRDICPHRAAPLSAPCPDGHSSARPLSVAALHAEPRSKPHPY